MSLLLGRLIASAWRVNFGYRSTVLISAKEQVRMAMPSGTSELKQEERMRFSVLMVGMAALIVIASPVLVSRAVAADDANTCAQANGDKAIAACTHVIENFGASANDRAIAYVNRGAEYRAKRDIDRAIADNTEAIRLDPGYANAYVGRGAAYALERYFDRALTDFNEAIRLDPNYANAYSARGRAYASKGEFDRALSDYNEAIRLDPNGTRAYYNRGDLYRVKGDFDRAIGDFNEAIRVEPTKPHPYYHRGGAYLNKGAYLSAAADYVRGFMRDK
jgi:tetratricopeptide (TPR) repeat protein